MDLPIETNRLQLTELTLADLTAYEKLISIPEIAAGAGFNLVSNQQMLGAVAKRQITTPNSFGIRIHDRLVGAILLYEQVGFDHQPDPANLELSYFLHPDLWRQGIMSEALTKLIEELAVNPTIETLNAEVFSDNQASKGVLKKVGFQVKTALIDPLVGKEKTIYQLALH